MSPFRHTLDAGAARAGRRYPQGAPRARTPAVSLLPTAPHPTEEALRLSDAAIAAVSQGVVITDARQRIVSVNDAFVRISGYPREALLGRTCAFLQGPLTDPATVARIDEALKADLPFSGEILNYRRDGTAFWNDLSISPLFDTAGRVSHYIGVTRDVTDRRQTAQRLEDSHHLLQNLARHVPGVIYQYRLFPDGHTCFPFASDGLWAIYEVTPESVRQDSTSVSERLHPDDRAEVHASIEVSARTLQPWHHAYRVLLPIKGLRWLQGHAQPERLADGSVLWHGYIADITDQKTAEAHTHRLAFFDALTGLPNRRMLIDRLAVALAAARREAGHGAVLYLDLDQFKHINDARGHATGDAVLVQVASRLGGLLRGADCVARLGGDEFVVVVTHLGHDPDIAARHAGAVADKLRRLLEQPFDIDGHSYTVGGSTGITLFPRPGQTVDDLLREADTAMYRAKAAGRHRTAFFEAGMQAEVEERLALEQALKTAIDHDALDVHVQPQVDAAGQVAGAELLLRWTHPTRGPVSPAAFIPVAEETGMIVALGDRVIRRACQALVALRRAGHGLTLSVNVSPRQFRREQFVQGVREILADTGAPADGLIFEVTENLLIDNWQDTRARMCELVALGIRFSIDDFGTGYSSLAYLKKLPLYELKIDRSFVQDAPVDPSDAAIVESMLSVAAHLKLRVVAEGVETEAQADFLRARGCDGLQGFLFARPEPLDGWLTRLGAG